MAIEPGPVLNPELHDSVMTDETATSRRLSLALQLAFGSAVSVVSLGGCSGERASCPGVSIGSSYELVVGAASSGTPADQQCIDAWGFAPGTEYKAEIVDVGAGDGDGCRSGIPSVSGSGGWELHMNSSQFVTGGLLLEGQYAISNNSCVGRAKLGVACDDCRYSAEPCACGLNLNVIADGNGCPSACNVTMAVTVSRL